MPENDELKKYLDYDGLAYLLQRFPKTTVHCTFDSEFAGETATLTHGTTTYTKTVPATSPFELTFAINELGTWTLNCSYLGTQYSDSVDITYLGQKGEIELTIVPDGSTAEPVNSIPIWLKCANLNKSYTTLAEVLADTETYETLLADSNACQYMKRSTAWALAEGLVPEMTSATTPSGNVTTNSYYDNFYGWKAFDRTKSDGWMPNYVSTRVDYGDWIKYDFGSSKIIRHFYLWAEGGYVVNLKAKIQASNDDSTWVDIHSFNIITAQNVDYSLDETFANDTPYRYWKLSIDSMYLQNQYSFGIRIFQFYSDADITHSQDAMARLGKFDYASNTLLSDSTWCEAIASSDCWDSVLNIVNPKMTSNTAPSGEVIYSTYYDNNYLPYYAFNENSSNQWCPSASDSDGNCYIGYSFTDKVLINKVSTDLGNATSWKVQGSNTKDTNDWHDLATSTDSTSNIKTLIFANGEPYRHYRLLVMSKVSTVPYSSIVAKTVKFYGRATEEVLVPLVPTMTSATTPSGEVKSNVATYSNYHAYYVFDGNDSTSAYWTQTNNPCVEYDFASGQSYIVKRFMIYPSYSSQYGLFAKDYKIEASNDGETWTTLYTGTFANSNVGKVYIDIENNTAYSRYRLYFTSETYANGKNWQIHELQFYAKTVQTNIIHSTPNDTIYMLEDGDPIVLATTNSDGDGILDFSQLPAGPVTLYSSVAKDLEDPTVDYHKTITITKTQYGGTTEAYLRPSTIGMLYWWGYDAGKLEDISSANGWNIWNNPFSPPSRTTNYINATTNNTANTCCGVGTINKEPSSANGKVKIVIDNLLGASNSIQGNVTKAVSGSGNPPPLSEAIDVAGLKCYEAEYTNDYYVCAFSVRVNGASTLGSMHICAWWYE